MTKEIAKLTSNKDQEAGMISSHSSRYGAYGSVFGIILALLINLLLLDLGILLRVSLLTACIFVGRLLGKLIAAWMLNRTPIVTPDHLSEFQTILRQMVPASQLPAATRFMLALDPHPVLLQDPTWIARSLPEKFTRASDTEVKKNVRTSAKKALTD